MSPDQISAITALANLLSSIGGWPLGVIIFVIIIGPWLFAMYLNSIWSSRFEAVVKMYKDNVSLVEELEEIANDLKDVVIMNTQAMTRLGDNIEKNQFCPMVRLEKQAKGVQL